MLCFSDGACFSAEEKSALGNRVFDFCVGVYVRVRRCAVHAKLREKSIASKGDSREE